VHTLAAMLLRNRAFTEPAVSNICMRRTIFCFLLIAGGLWAQASSGNDTEKAAIQRAKNALVSSLDSSMPKVSLEFFLNYEAGGKPVKWEVTDCPEQTRNPSIGHRGDSDMCVEADFEKDQIDVAVLVSVGKFEKGPSGDPAFFSASVTQPSGRRLHLRRLGDLPKELHRPARGMPRDLPFPTTASSESPSAAPGACSHPA
jgi:hypothetical protein